MASRLRPFLPVIRLLALTLMILAISRPQLGRKSVEVISEGIDIILAIDTSGSMRSLDFFIQGKKKTRLEVVKKVVAEFVKKREADRIGMVVFGENAFTQCPLTLDHGIVLSFLKDLEIGAAGEGGTAIGSSLATSVNRLKDIKSKSKIIILLTDGKNNAGKVEPLMAASLAEKFNMKVYTIGVGIRGEAPILVNTIFGMQEKYIPVDIDEDLLKTIATDTNGKYYRATGTEELKNIYEDIDQLEKTEIKTKEHVEYNELYSPLLIGALLLLLLEIILVNTRFKSIP